MMARIHAADPDEVMPPKESSRALTAEQKEVLKRWIAAGAADEAHWAFTPPQRAPLPSVARRRWPRRPLDFFILSRLEAEGLKPSPEADRATLLRRVSLDLTGLPPTPEDADAFLADRSASAYERVVDRLLQSPHYGERLAVDWLDAARFADSNGYQVDRDREMYAWRDWVIGAFNRNLSYDQFTVEQIAGDLLPRATIEQRIATGFHRNQMMNEEGGIIPEEFLAEYCADRVETTATVWLGQTFTCARCHDHKFDPFTQRDYYGLFAFFNNVSEKGVGDYGANIRRNNPPMLQLPAPELEARRERLRGELAETKRELGRLRRDLEAAGPSWDGRVPINTNGARLSARLAAIPREIDKVDLEIPTTLVMQEMETPRPTHVLVRGAYDRNGERVFAHTPETLPPMEGRWPTNRLGLARWLVAKDNPLTARVTVNRYWQMVFGTGLVRTAEDFGTQGERPSHPELLDWLAVEFVESGWDVQALLRMLVTSSTYRQSSKLTAVLQERDPENRLLARAPRVRLPAEFIRDQALAASGLLVPKIGGPSVRPYHPPGLYEQVVAGTGPSTYVQGKGDELYRRSLYTYWKRSVPNPALLVFDAPFREACTVRRPRTNTPLQALNLMNDPTYVEAARRLAERAWTETAAPSKTASDTISRRLTRMFRWVAGRAPRDRELAVLKAAWGRSLLEFSRDRARAELLIKVGASRPDPNLDAAELAAATMVASTVLNLDELVMKE